MLPVDDVFLPSYEVDLTRKRPGWKKMGPRTDFAWAIDAGVKAYQHARKLTALEITLEEIGRKIGVSSRTLQRWRSESIPKDYETVREFARVCLEVAPDLGGQWVLRLFRAAGMASYTDHALKDLGVGLTPHKGRLYILIELSGLPPDAPIYNHFGHAMMRVLGQLDLSSIAIVMRLLLLLVLGFIWAWAIAKGEELTLHFWEQAGIVWLGLTILPVIAGSFPQYREREIYAKSELAWSQRLALLLEKALGIYVSAFLGEVVAIVTWISLFYVGLWSNLSLVSKVVFWFFAVLATSTLSFVGATIATEYSWNLVNLGQAPRLRWDGILLGLGFPFIVYPVWGLFAWITASLWSRWQTGCPIIIVASLLWALLLRREAKR
jgi:transcriptional regulator with XRE-family HTH domain